jgi:hypothetical protein
MVQIYEAARRQGAKLDMARKRSGSSWSEAYRKGYRGQLCRWPHDSIAYACYIAGADAKKEEA